MFLFIDQSGAYVAIEPRMFKGFNPAPVVA